MSIQTTNPDPSVAKPTVRGADMQMLETAPRMPEPHRCLIERDVTVRVRIPEARDLLRRELGASAAVTRLLNHLVQSGGRPMLFAGAVRDALEAVQTGRQYSPPRDLDIGVVGVRRELFDEILHGEQGRLNRFGGYRLITNGCPPLDIWRLEETLGVRVNGAPLTLGNVLRSFVISLNAVAFDPLGTMFYDCGSLASIKSRRRRSTSSTGARRSRSS